MHFEQTNRRGYGDGKTNGRMRCSKKMKTKIIRANGLSKALYGCEVAKCGKKQIASLKSAIVDAIGPKSVRRSATIVLEAGAKETLK